MKWRVIVICDQLEHAIRALSDLAKATELWIFGSQAILGEIPDPPESLRASIEIIVTGT